MLQYLGFFGSIAQLSGMLSINTIGIPVAAFGLLNLLISSAAMAFSSISIVLNALRLKRFKE